MSKAKWEMSGYKGRPDPLKVAGRVMLILIIILSAGFVKAGTREGWFEAMMNAIGY